MTTAFNGHVLLTTDNTTLTTVALMSKLQIPLLVCATYTVWCYTYLGKNTRTPQGQIPGLFSLELSSFLFEAIVHRNRFLVQSYINTMWKTRFFKSWIRSSLQKVSANTVFFWLPILTGSIMFRDLRLYTTFHWPNVHMPIYAWNTVGSHILLDAPCQPYVSTATFLSWPLLYWE